MSDAGHKKTCESVFPFYYAGSRDQTWVVQLGSKHLYPLTHLAGSTNFL